MEGSRASTFDINNEKLRKIQQENIRETVGEVTIDYFGHSSIRITSPAGITLLIDPFRNDDSWGWWFPDTFPEVEVDIAISTHAHFDHDALHIPKALITAERLIGTYQIGDLKITGLADKHMSASVGKTRWTDIQKDTGENFAPPTNNLHMDNIIYVIETGGATIVHWGDNRSDPDTFVDNYLKKIPIDVIFLPVDESEHILGYEQADKLIREYRPGLAIPIHYLIHGVNTVLSTLQPADPWVNSHENILDIGSHRLTLEPGKYPQDGTTIATFANHYTRE